MARPWKQKFADAFRGMREGIRGQSSFVVHFFIALAVLAAAAMLHMGAAEWGLLLVCITVVLAAEMFNSALEATARAIGSERSPHLRDALDMASAAVLIAAIGSLAVGLAVFGGRIVSMIRWAA